MTDLLFFGIQGSGKGTQADKLASFSSSLIFGSGLTLRQYIQDKSGPVVDEIKHDLKEGLLVRDEIIIKLLREFIDTTSLSTHIIFDGIPRNVAQVHILEELLRQKGRDIRGIYFDVSVSETLRRIRSRRHCEDCGHAEVLISEGQQCSICSGRLIKRDDDMEERVIMRRFQTFYQHTFPVISYLMMEKKIDVIEAHRTPEEIFDDVKKIYLQYNS